MCPVGIFGSLTQCTAVKRPRDESGRLGGNAYADSAFLEAVRDQNMPTTGDVARAVGCNRGTAHKRLKVLAESGDVESTEVGSALVWAISD